jgi:two-component system, LuxR family, response regulator FixJ
LTHINSRHPDSCFEGSSEREQDVQTQAQPPAQSSIVAVVDDDYAVRLSLRFALEIEGFTVRTYADGGALLSDAGTPPASCLVIDENMPGIRGLDVVETLRARQDRVPAILIASRPTAALNARAARAGVPVVEKPLLGSTLVDCIRDALSHDGRPRPS